MPSLPLIPRLRGSLEISTQLHLVIKLWSEGSPKDQTSAGAKSTNLTPLRSSGITTEHLLDPNCANLVLDTLSTLKVCQNLKQQKSEGENR